MLRYLSREKLKEKDFELNVGERGIGHKLGFPTSHESSHATIHLNSVSLVYCPIVTKSTALRRNI
jgi:hypothetical protein